jgi:Leucine-rich repeat (LRR) protein
VILQGNSLERAPVDALRRLRRLSLLDLSRNRIGVLPDDAFASLRLQTLKLADNDLTLAPGSLRGLESSLRNLNLKGTGLGQLPAALTNMTALAFLDLAQNDIRSLETLTVDQSGRRVLETLDSLTALNLERNMIKELPGDAFLGVADTLSSLSLLNNLIVEYPLDALSTLTELRVRKRKNILVYIKLLQ